MTQQLEIKTEETKKTFKQDYDSEIKSLSMKKDPLPEITVFPDDHIEVQQIKRELRIEEDTTRFDESSLYHQECAKTFYSDWVSLNRKYRRYQNTIPTQEREKIEPEKFEIDYLESRKTDENYISLEKYQFSTNENEDEKNLKQVEVKKEELNNEILNLKPTKEAFKKNSNIRQEKSRNLFHLFSDIDIENQIGDSRQPTKPFGEPEAYRFIIEPIELKMITQEQIEPFYCILFLFDTSKKKKISENFRFELNPEKFNRFVLQKTENLDYVTMPKKAIFQVAQPSNSIYLVLVIEKILQGSYDSVIETYSKGLPTKGKALNKLKAKVQETCQRLSKYRQTVGWSVFPLFQYDMKNNTLEETFRSTETQKMEGFYRAREDMSEEQMISLMTDKKSTPKKPNLLNGTLLFKIHQFEKELEQKIHEENIVVDTSLRTVKIKGKENKEQQEKDQTKTRQAIPVREIESFPIEKPLVPKMEYVNNMYIYLRQLNIANVKGSSARNISIKLQMKENDTDLHSEGLTVFYGNVLQKRFMDHQLTAVQYHNRKPKLYDEIKILLPLHLTPQHHVLFSLYHVNCKLKKQKKSEGPFGHCAMPVFHKQFMIDGEYTLPIGVALPVSGYLSSPELVMQEKQKNFLQVQVKVESSVYPQNPHVIAFFQGFRNYAQGGKTKLVETMIQLRAHAEEIGEILVHFSAVLLNLLVKLICEPENNENEDNEDEQKMTQRIRAEAFATFARVAYQISLLQDEKECDVLRTYSDFIFDDRDSQKKVYIEIPAQWNQILARDIEAHEKGGEEIRAEGNEYVNPAAFFLELITKSMGLELDSSGKLKGKHDWKMRFSDSAIESIRALGENITRHVRLRSSKGLNVAKRLNQAFANFLKDLFGVMPTGEVFRLAKRHIKILRAQPWESSLETLKYEFLQNLIDYENFLPLNLPVVVQMSTTTNLTKFLASRHFLAGILIRTIFRTIEEKEATDRAKLMAVGVLRDLIAKHDADPKLRAEGAKARFCGVYLLYVLMLIDHVNLCKKQNTEIRRSMLVVFLYILKNIDREYLCKWFGVEALRRRLGLFEALGLCLGTFEYAGKKKLEENERTEKIAANAQSKTVSALDALEQSYAGGAKMMKRKRRELQSMRVAPKSEKEETKSGENNINTEGPQHPVRQFSVDQRTAFETMRGTISGTLNNRPPVFTNAVNEGALATEVGIVVLDVTEDLYKRFAKELEQEDVSAETSVLGQIFHVLVAFLRKNQSNLMLSIFFSSLTLFVRSFENIVFIHNNHFLSELCTQIFGKTVSHDDTIRAAANSMLYMLFRRNHEVCGNFVRTQIHTTIAFSRLVGDPEQFKEEVFVRRALLVLKKYADIESRSLSEFARKMHVHADEMSNILRDSVKLKKYRYDPEMTAHLYHRIADGYNKAPDLRLTWLESLQKFHINNKNFTEATLASLHMCALVGEYLHLMHPDNLWLPQGARAFASVSATCVNESCEMKTSDIERFCQSPFFTEKGLISVLKKTARDLKKCKLLEAQVELYSLLIPIYKHARDYPALSSTHHDLKLTYDELIEDSQSVQHSQTLGAYFRVAFFGTKFGELNTREFVYRESDLTHLFSLTERLKSQFSPVFGSENVVILQTSTPPDTSTLSPDKVYLQVTALTPYFPESEENMRVTRFQRSFDISNFQFQTPFTKTGKTQGSIGEQWIRKTVLSCDGHFPYIVKRLPVVDKKVTELSPIIVSLENLRSKNIELSNILSAKEKNINLLQSILSGACLTAVNVGPFEICKVFLSPPFEYPLPQVLELRDEFRKFILMLSDAINENEKYAKDNQKEFNQAVKQGFHTLKENSESFLDDNNFNEAEKEK